MRNILTFYLSTSLILMVGCSSQEPQKPPAANESGSNAIHRPNQPGTPEIKEGEILKPGVLQVEVPEDIPLPENTIVVSGTHFKPKDKKHFYIQVPDVAVAQECIDFFATELPKHGWEVLNGNGEEQIANIISLDFKKEKKLGRIDAIIKQERAGTILHIRLEPINN